MKLAIIGAGVTGSLLAHLLSSKNIDISVFEKSRGCGGRASTKSATWGQCDIGATIVPAKQPLFLNFMEQLASQKLASRWPKDIYQIENLDGQKSKLGLFQSDREHFIFNKKMSGICRYWIDDANLRTNSLVEQVKYQKGIGWRLHIDGQWLQSTFDTVVVTVPWPQVAGLVKNSGIGVVDEQLTMEQHWSSCWSVALTLSKIVKPNVDLAYLKGHVIQTLVRDSAKPQRPDISGGGEIWVAQLSNELSDRLGKKGAQQAIRYARDTLCQLFDMPEAFVVPCASHYWKFARPAKGEHPLGVIQNADLGLFIGGDWSFGASVEAAYETANEICNAIVNM